jgi:hypothetical protein
LPLKQYNFKNSTHTLNSNSWTRLQVIARTFFLSLLDLSKRALRSSSHIITAHLELASQITLQKVGLSTYLKPIGVVEKGLECCGEGKASGEAVGAAYPDVGGLGAHRSTRTGRPTPRDPGYRGRGLMRLASVESGFMTAISRLH